MTSFWKSTWYEDPEPLDEGQRGGGERAGVAGFATFQIRGEFLTYPACSKHGGMNKLGKERPIWRCLVTGCNVGTEIEAPLEHYLTGVTDCERAESFAEEELILPIPEWLVEAQIVASHEWALELNETDPEVRAALLAAMPWGRSPPR